MPITDEDLAAAMEFLPSGGGVVSVDEVEELEGQETEAYKLPDAYTEEELLTVVADERRRSIGFGGGSNSDELNDDREKALNYAKGEMPDMPTMPNRSKAVSTDVADAVETLLPDMVDIFTGGEDVATFQPVGAEDEEGAAQETDYVNHVVFNENPGFLTLYTIFKDALLQKIGVVKFWWEDQPAEVREERFTNKDAAELQFALEAAASQGAVVSDIEPDGENTYSFTIRQETKRGKVAIKAVPPDDFTVAASTVTLAETHYCAMRSRLLAQDLVAMGLAADLVDELPAYGSARDEGIEQARDTAGEHANGSDQGGQGMLRTVEIVEHHIRLLNTAGEMELWQVITGGGETRLLHCERVEGLPYAAITPFLNPHRFYGRSIADVLMEIQRIKTALTRMALDSGYFALNQRYEVATANGRANDFTVGDLLRNEPGAPIRSNDGQSVRAIGGGRLDFDAFGALEYFSVAGESRSGIVRNAQGLKPDTLHDTAKGAMALMGAAQKRVRLIARVFAETGIKDLFLGVHDLIRRNATASAKVRLRGKWAEVDPTSWGARNDMEIMVGLGSGGQAQDMQAAQMIGAYQEKLIALQGGSLTGPFIKPANITAALQLIAKAGRIRGVERYFSEPPPENPNAPQQQPPPDPKAIEAQGKAQAEAITAQGKAQKEQAETQAALQRAAAKQQFDQQQAAAKFQLDERVALAKLEQDERVRMAQLQAEVELKQRQQDAEFALRREQMAKEAQLAAEAQMLGQTIGASEASLGSDVQFGGEIG